MKQYYTKPIVKIEDMGQDVIRMSYTYDVYNDLYPASLGEEELN